MGVLDREADLDQLVDAGTPYAVKVSGEFSALLTRSVGRQTSPYQPLADVLEGQVEFPLEQVTATMVGFRLPDYMAESNAAGYHFHAVTEDRDAVAISWTAKRPTSPSSSTPSTPGRSIYLTASDAGRSVRSNWAGIVANAETIPAQIAVWDESRPDGGGSGQFGALRSWASTPKSGAR